MTTVADVVVLLMPREQRDHKEMEQRRKRGAVMFDKGYPAAEVARRVGVSRQAATRWKGAWLEGGSRMAGDGMVLSADKKVVKIWDRNTVCRVRFLPC